MYIIVCGIKVKRCDGTPNRQEMQGIVIKINGSGHLDVSIVYRGCPLIGLGTKLPHIHKYFHQWGGK